VRGVFSARLISGINLEDKEIKMTGENISGDYCENRVLEYNERTGRLWHPPYCRLSRETGKIKCKHLGSRIELTISNSYKIPKKMRVNTCDLGDKNKKQRTNKSLANFIKGIFKR